MIIQAFSYPGPPLAFRAQIRKRFVQLGDEPLLLSRCLAVRCRVPLTLRAERREREGKRRAQTDRGRDDERGGQDDTA